MKIIGHRGAKGLAPENTLAALRKGLEHGADSLEFDVRVTKDKVPVLAHDSSIEDASGNRLQISAHKYDELLQHKADLTTLQQALDYIDAKAVPYIEVKQGEPVTPIIAVLQEYIGGMYSAADLLLGSKSQKTLRELHDALPEVPKIVIEPWSGVWATRRARQVGTKKLAMNRLWLWWGFIQAIQRGGYELYAYTLNDNVKARKWAKYGMAGVVTDYPDRFKK